MPRSLVLLVIAGAFLAACAAKQPTPYGPPVASCDDGGTGGVVIDGVCL